MKLKSRLAAYGITLNVLALGFVSFFTDVSTEMMLAALPAFFLALGITPTVIGFIEGLAETSTSLIRVVSGEFSDRVRRYKALTFAGYFLSSVVKPLLAFASLWFHVLAIRVADRVGKGIRTPPRDAIISFSASGERMGRAFGIHRTLDQLGGIVGPIIAAVLLPIIGFYNLFLLTAIPGALALFVLYKWVTEPRIPQLSKRTSHLKEAWNSPGVRLYLASVVFYSFSAFSYVFFIYRLHDATKLSIIFAPAIYTIIQVAHTASAFPAGEFSDRYGRIPSVAVGYLLAALSYILAVVTDLLPVLLVAAVLYGAHKGFLETTQRAVIPDLVSKEHRGAAYGLYNTAVGVAALPSNLLAGFLYTIYGSWAPLTLGTASLLAAMTPLIRVQKKLSP